MSDLFKEEGWRPDPTQHPSTPGMDVDGQSQGRRELTEKGLALYDRNFNYLDARLQHGLDIEEGAIDDWSRRFKDDYLNQMRQGIRRGAGDMRADAGISGFNPALMRAAQQGGAQMQAHGVMDSEAIGRQMDYAHAMSKYAQAQRAANMNLAAHSLYSTIDAHKLGQELDRDLEEARRLAEE